MEYTPAHHLWAHMNKYEKQCGIHNDPEQSKLIMKLFNQWIKSYHEFTSRKNPSFLNSYTLLSLLIRTDCRLLNITGTTDYYFFEICEKAQFYLEYKDRIEEILSRMDSINHNRYEGQERLRPGTPFNYCLCRKCRQ